MARLLHVFASDARLWTPCGARVQVYDGIVHPRVAREASLFEGAGTMADCVICVGCAHRRRGF